MNEVLPSRTLVAAWLFGLLISLAASVSGDANELLNLDDHRGKVVVVDFWASWCVPCRRSFPWMNEMHAKYGDDGLVIIGVNMDAEDDAAQQFLADYPADFRIVYDREGDLAREFDVIAMPSSYVFDRDGNQVTRHLGFKVRNQEDYESLIVETLNK